MENNTNRKQYRYRSHIYKRTLPVPEYINRFRDIERFTKLCEECSLYGNFWACPPFSPDVKHDVEKYENVMIVASKIVPTHDEILPITESRSVLLPERRRLERLILDMEKAYDGRALGFAGSCTFCEGEQCARLSDEACRHPEKARPSLEALGFDVCNTVSELFGFDIKWGKDGKMPEYLVLVAAIFHNGESK